MTTISDTEFIEKATQLVCAHQYDSDFPEPRPDRPDDETTEFIGCKPTKLTGSEETGMALMAIYRPIEGTTTAIDGIDVDMRHPKLIQLLRGLAVKGKGSVLQAEDIRVIFWFSTCKCSVLSLKRMTSLLR